MPHIKHTAGGDFEGRAWCGERVWSHDWAFQSLDHAAYASADQDSVEVCVACARKAAEALLWQSTSKECIEMKLLGEESTNERTENEG
jgi:hypothetical protein